MRNAAVMVLVLFASACQLEPPPPKKQPAPAETTPAPQPAPQPPQPAPPPPEAAAPVDAGVAPADADPRAIAASEACITVGAHVAQVFIESATDPGQKAIYEQERQTMTRLTAEACQKQAWAVPAQKCYLAAKTPAAIKACETKFPPPPPHAGSGATPPGRIERGSASR